MVSVKMKWNMAVKMSDATHERFYDVGKWQRILLIVIIMSKYE